MGQVHEIQFAIASKNAYTFVYVLSRRQCESKKVSDLFFFLQFTVNEFNLNQ